MTDTQKLHALVDTFADGSRQHFAQLLNLPVATITTWFFRGSITAKGRERILDTFPGVNREWLLRDAIDMMTPEPDTVGVPREHVIPFFNDIEGTCGAVEMPFNPEYATDNIYLPGVTAMAAICAQGDSMYPTIQDGDVVLVGTDTTLRDIHSDTIYLICTREGHRMFKRIEQATTRQIMAVSDNPNYTPRATLVEKRDILHLYPALRIVRKL